MLSRMDIGRALDTLPARALSPREKLLQALAMYEEGVELQRLTIRRRFPDMSELELESKLQSWLAREDEAS